MMKKEDLTKEMLSEKGMLDVAKYSQQDGAFYSSKEWRIKSKRYKDLNPFCEVCLKDNLKKSSSIVHHITPISRGGDPFDENNLLALCKKCHSEIHTGIGVKIDINFLMDSRNQELKPEDEWWESELPDRYADEQNVIVNLITKAKGLEKENVSLSIETYYEACKKIDDFDRDLNSDPLLEKAYCQELGVKTFRTVRYPINRLSLLLEKEKRYKDCIQLINDHQEKYDKIGLTDSDLKAIQKRRDRVAKKITPAP